MKRIFTILIALTMVLCLFACDGGSNGGNGGVAYKGELDGEKTTLVINGNKATFSAEVKNDLGEANVVLTQKVTQTGIIESNEDGVLTIVFNQAGATASMSMKISGSGASEYKKMAKEQFEGMEGAYYDAMLKLLDGKTLNMKYGDELWNVMGPADNVIVVKIDTANKTFTQMDSGIG